jgi:hypothetical protein
MKKFVASLLSFAFIFTASSVLAAGSKAKRKAAVPSPTAYVLKTSKGAFVWDRSLATLFFAEPNSTFSAVADSLRDSTLIAAAKHPQDPAAVYYLRDGKLLPYQIGSGDQGEAERITPWPIKKFVTVNLGSVAGAALGTGGNFLVWKLKPNSPGYEALDITASAIDFVVNPFYSANPPKCKWLWEKRKFTEWPIFVLLGSNGRVQGFNLKNFKIYDIQVEKKFENLSGFVTSENVGKCTPMGN